MFQRVCSILWASVLKTLPPQLQMCSSHGNQIPHVLPERTLEGAAQPRVLIFILFFQQKVRLSILVNVSKK